MQPHTLAANFKPPRMQLKHDGASFYWDGVSNRYPRTRYRLDYLAGSRAFTLWKFWRFSRSCKEMKRVVKTPPNIAVFRSSLTPEQVATITRMSMPRSSTAEEEVELDHKWKDFSPP